MKNKFLFLKNQSGLKENHNMYNPFDTFKHTHIKSRLDECKKFDEELKLRYIVDRMIKLYKILRCQTCTRDQHISDFIKMKNDPANIKEFTKETLGVPWEPHK